MDSRSSYMKNASSSQSKEGNAERLERTLHDLNISEKVNVATIESWFSRPDAERQGYLRTTLCLLPMHASPADAERLAGDVFDYYNTCFQREDTAKDGFKSLELHHDVIDFSREKAFSKFASAAEYLQKENSTHCLKDSQAAFTALLDDLMIVDEPYRLFGNLAMAYVMHGDRLLADLALDQALALNSKYDFAVSLRERLDRGDYDGHLLSKRSFVEKSDVASLSTDALVSRLHDVGILASVDDFVHQATAYISSDDFFDQEWEMKLNDHLLEDFAWMSVGVFYERLLPSHCLIEAFDDLLEKFADTGIDDDGEINTLLCALERYVRDASDHFWQTWSSRGDADAIVGALDACADLLATPYHDRIITLALQLADKGSECFLTLRAISAIMRADPSWRNEFSNIEARYPHDPIAPQLVFEALCAKGMYTDALRIVEDYVERLDIVQDGQASFAPFDFSWYEARRTAYDLLMIEHKRQGDAVAVKATKKKISELKKLQKVADAREDAAEVVIEKFAQLMAEEKTRRSQALPSRMFFEYLQSLGINFETKVATTSPIVCSVNGETIKIGRNDPCPCGALKPDGSPIKFKKCHGL